MDACLPVVSISPNLLKLCTAGNNAACVDYREATYSAAQASPMHDISLLACVVSPSIS